MATIPQVLNLISLARSSQAAAQVPGTILEVWAIRQAQSLTLNHDIWLIVLEGELIIDLPFGDFRVLKPGECLTLTKDTKINLQPIEDTTVLWQNLQST